MTNTDLIAQLEKLQKEATPAPWTDEVTDSGDLIVRHNGVGVDVLYFGDMEDTDGADHSSASLIVALRNNLPQILQALRVQEAARRAIEAAKSIRSLSAPVYWSRTFVADTFDEAVAEYEKIIARNK